MTLCVKVKAIYKKHSPWWRKHNLQGDILACGGLSRDLSVGIPKTPSNSSVSETSKDKGENEVRAPLLLYSFDLSSTSQKDGILLFSQVFLFVISRFCPPRCKSGSWRNSSVPKSFCWTNLPRLCGRHIDTFDRTSSLNISNGTPIDGSKSLEISLDRGQLSLRIWGASGELQKRKGVNE